MPSPPEILLTMLVLTGLFGSLALQWLLNGMALTFPHVRQFFWHKALSVMAVGVLFLSGAAIAVSLVTVYVILLAVVGAMVVVDAVISFRRAEYRSLHNAVHGMLSQRLPLPLALRQFAAERRDGMGRRMAIAAERMEMGEPPEKALQVLVPGNDLETTLALRLVPETGDLVAPFEPRPESHRAFDRSTVELQNLLLYLLFLTLASASLVRAIFHFMRDFLGELGVEPLHFVSGGVSIETLGSRLMWGPFGSDGVLPLMMILWALLILLVWLLHVTGGLGGALPLSHHWNRLLDRARVLETLAFAVQRNRPIAETLGFLANVYPQRGVCRQTRRMSERISQGEEDWQVLRQAGLVKRDEQRLLAASEKTGNLPWVLRDIAYRNRRRHVQRMKRFVHLLAFATLMIIGMATLIAVLQVFGLLTGLIYAEAPPHVI